MIKKLFYASLTIFGSASNANHDSFEVLAVGVSAGKQTVFIVVNKDIAGTPCGYKNQFKIELTDDTSAPAMPLALNC